MSSRISYPGPGRLRKLPRNIVRRVGRWGWFRVILRPLVRVPTDRQWAFILGCYDGGTTLLHDLIAESKSCARLPGEGVFLTSELVAPEALGWTRMWWKVQEEMASFGGEAGGNADIVKKDWSIWYDVRRPVLLEKSISDAVRIPWLDRNFPGAKFVALTRNGYAVAEGIRRRAGGSLSLPEGLTEYPIEWCAQQWVASCTVIDQGMAQLDRGRVLRLSYEELCREPSEWLARIGSFLGLPDLGSGDVQHVNDMNESAIGRLSPQDIVAINRVAAAELARQGYDMLQPVFSTGDGPKEGRQ